MLNLRNIGLQPPVGHFGDRYDLEYGPLFVEDCRSDPRRVRVAKIARSRRPIHPQAANEPVKQYFGVLLDR
jgi:hypothetical protein